MVCGVVCNYGLVELLFEVPLALLVVDEEVWLFEMKIGVDSECGVACHECHVSIVWDLLRDWVAKILAYSMGEVRYGREKAKFQMVV